ncbi:helix-turn-helix domain-containing protein, partial [Enterobacter hormaechei subsp. hoffmannii]
MKLADNASDHGECWPSYQHIADQCEISKRSVMIHIDALCECGLVKKELRPGPKGNSSNVYRLDFSSAGDSLGASANRSLPGAADSPRSAGDSLGGSAGAAPRISHSFEPFNESVIEPKYNGSSDNHSENRSSKENYSNEFEQA